MSSSYAAPWCKASPQTSMNKPHEDKESSEQIYLGNGLQKTDFTAIQAPWTSGLPLLCYM
ncbi:hypothetical protein M9458_029056, partial [Cirrhinus mrigala]